MTTTIESAGFPKSVRACVADIDALLPGLSYRYPTPVILDALAEHVGSAMQVLVHKNLCSARHADLMIKQLEKTAFLRQSVQAKSQKNPDETPSG